MDGYQGPTRKGEGSLIASSMVGMRLPRRTGIAGNCHLAPSRLNARVLVLVIRACLASNLTGDRQPGRVRCSRPEVSRNAKRSHGRACMTAYADIRPTTRLPAGFDTSCAYCSYTRPHTLTFFSCGISQRPLSPDLSLILNMTPWPLRNRSIPALDGIRRAMQ